MGYHETPVLQLPVVASTGGKTLSRRLFGYLCVCKLCACVRARELSPQVKVLKGKESLSRGGEGSGGIWTPATRLSSVIDGLESQVNLLAIYIYTCASIKVIRTARPKPVSWQIAIDR